MSTLKVDRIETAAGLSPMIASGEALEGYVLAADGIGGSEFAAPAGGGAGLTDVTYADLVALIGSGGLTPGAWYRLTDYATTHYIVDADGTQYVTGDGMVVGPTEPLLLFAVSESALAPECYSETYPQDVLHYDWNPTNYLNDLAFATGGATIIDGWTGVITFRHDTQYDNYAGFDWRVCLARRWETNADPWDANTGYYPQGEGPGSIVNYNSGIWQALALIPEAEAQVSSLQLTGTSGTATIAAGGVAGTAEFATDLATTASDFVTAYVEDFLAAGIVLTADGDTLVFAANVLGVAFTEPTATNLTGDLCLAVAQVDTITLSGDSGTAEISGAGGLTKSISFNGTLIQTAGDFVSLNRLDYENQGIRIIAETYTGQGRISFTAIEPGTPFTSPVIVNLTGTLAGTVTNDTPNNPAPTITLVNANVPPNSVPDSEGAPWVQILDLGTYTYWNVSPTASNGVPSSVEYADLPLFDATAYAGETIVGNHLESTPNAEGTCLVKTVFFGPYCSANTFGTECSANTFGPYCYGNAFGAGCYGNTFGTNCNYNTFGTYCSANTFGTECSANTFGPGCYGNSFGRECSANTFGTYCSANTFGPYCSANTFGTYCYGNTFGTECKMLQADDYALIGLDLSDPEAEYATILTATVSKRVYVDYGDGTPTIELAYRDGGTETIIELGAWSD